MWFYCNLFLVLAACGTATSCNTPAFSEPGQEKSAYFHKDLSEQMDAMTILQGSIGEAMKRNNMADVAWLVQGLDSVCQVVVKYQNQHHNLLRPFEHYYKRKLQTPIQGMKEAAVRNDTSALNRHYQLLVQRCNSCHNEHSVEERAHL